MKHWTEFGFLLKLNLCCSISVNKKCNYYWGNASTKQDFHNKFYTESKYFFSYIYFPPIGRDFFLPIFVLVIVPMCSDKLLNTQPTIYWIKWKKMSRLFCTNSHEESQIFWEFIVASSDVNNFACNLILPIMWIICIIFHDCIQLYTIGIKLHLQCLLLLTRFRFIQLLTRLFPSNLVVNFHSAPSWPAHNYRHTEFYTHKKDDHRDLLTLDDRIT